MSDAYRAALHAMQTGVAIEMEHDAKSTSPKHLRVGVNAAMCDHAALARLLVEKGVITKDEYEAAITAEIQREVERFEKRISERAGAAIHLG